MLNNLPIFIAILFGLTTAVTLLLFYWVLSNSGITSKKLALILIGLTDWLILQAIFTYVELYSSNIKSMPPPIMLLGIAPAILTIIILFTTKKGRAFIDSLSLAKITYLHIVRIPVEICLYWLFIYKTIPQIMTFEGRNLDIISGITAPLVAYFGIVKGKWSKQILLLWNFICLGLLANIVITALLSAPFPFQKLAFEQPNIAIFYFPFSWLPTFVVPMVLFAHLVSIRKLLLKEQRN